MKKFLSVLVLLVAFFNTLHAQEGCDINTGTCEVCDNGIDDDADGRADALDPKCAAFYGLEFVGDATDCSVDPPAGTSFWTFNNTQPVESSNNTVDTQSKMAIGDVDNDGIPDVVASSKFNQQIRVIATTDGQPDGSSSGDVKADFKLTGAASPLGGGGRNAYFDLELFIADINGDGIAEIFSIAFEINNSTKAIVEYYLMAFSYAPASLSLNWYVSLGSIRPGIPSIADFDGDGLAEVYLKNRIYAAESGALLADAGGNWLNTINAAPVAVNVNTASPNLELVCGNLIYNVPNLSSRSLQSLSIWKDMNSTASAANKYYPKTFIDVSEYGLTSFSSTSVADFDKDGDIDVFMTGATLSNNGQTAVWWWDPVGGGISVFEAAHPDVVNSGKGPPTTQTFPKGWTWGAGRINLGDIDGDGQLEATFVSGNQLFALENSGGVLGPAWATPRTINDSKSGIITTTVYDFENDGEPELVYRDAYELRIIDGTTGQDKPGVPAIECKSHTMSEGPIIADVNGDGATDICVPCYQATGAFDPSDGYSAQQRGSIHLYFSSSNSWLPTRKVWNQPGYFVVNIKDDLTVPNPQLNQNLNFGTAPCSNGVPGPNMPLNLFLNQVPNFSANGCPVYPGPDISFVGDDPNLQPGDPGYVDPSDPNYFPAVEVIPPICGDLEITVNFNIINDGLRAISSDIPTSFWDGDPSVDASATLLHTEVLPVANFGIGDTLSYNGVAFNSTGKAFTLYVVLNDDGTSAPPFAITGQIEECKLGNNIYAFPIVPEPFTVQIEIIQDNLKCEDAAPDNGELRAVVFESGLEAADYSKYGFQWYAGPDPTAPVVPNPKGQLDRLTGMVEGDYTVIVTNLDKGCESLPIDTTIVRIGVDPVITIVENSPQSQCSPFNGELEVFIDGGNAGYTFEWFKGAGFTPMGVTSSVISNLQQDEYFVRVNRDGCSKIASLALSGPIIPDGQATVVSNVTDCSTPNSGSVDAEAVIAGVIQDPAQYNFVWYHWDPNTNTLGSQISSTYGTGKSRSGMPVGWYAVVVNNSTTNCQSFPPSPVEIIDATQVPDLTISELTSNSSCDPNNPNGQLQVDITLGGIAQDPALYSISWFKGDNTLAANQVLTTGGINGEVVNGVGSPGIPYTALVSSALNCARTDTLSVSQSQVIPTLVGTAVNNSICNPALASQNYVGSITAVLTDPNGAAFGHTSSDYTYTWYDGTTPTAGNEHADPNPSTPLTLEELDGDLFYTLVVTNNILGCSTVPLIVEVKNIPDLPIIVITDVPETTCSAAGTPNGSLTAAVDVAGNTAGYTFEWYTGNSISGTQIGTVSGPDGETAINLNGNNNYTVRVINDATGCEDNRTFYLNDISSNPIVTLSKIDNGICDPVLGYVGSVTASITDPNGSLDFINDYAFTWYTGTTATPGNEKADPDPSTPLVLEAVDGNIYTLVVTNTVLGCTSLPQNIEVVDIPPTINILITENIASTNCTAAPNGILAAAVDNGGGPVTAGYSFTWYEGTDTNPGTGTLTNTDGNDFRAIDLQGGAGKNYTVVVREVASGCEETFTELLPNASELPVVTLTPVSNAGCEAGKYTGSVTANITYKGVPVVGAALADYSFAWAGPGADANPATPEVLDDIINGAYSLTVTNTLLGCTSLLANTTVTAQPAVITIASTNTPSTNCAPAGTPDGAIVSDIWVDINNNTVRDPGEDDPALFSYQWHQGTDTSTPIASATNADIAGIQGGTGRNYTLEVKHLNSGCTQTFTTLLGDASELPVVTLTPVSNAGCEAGKYTGSVTANITYKGVPVVGAALADYSFAWAGPGADANPATPEVLDDIINGAYSLTVTNTLLGCTSLLANTTVTAQPAVITIASTNTPSTNCAPAGTPDGAIVSDIWVDINNNTVRDPGEDDPALFSYQWHQGTDTSTPIASATNADIAGIQGGTGRNYTLEVKHLNSGCTQTFTTLLGDASELPVVTLTPVSNAGCEAGKYTGSVTANITYKGVPVVGAALADYSFAWAGPGADANPATPEVLDDIINGAYSLTVTNTLLGCTSLLANTTVTAQPAVITIASTNTPSTNCAPAGTPDGAIVSDIWVDINNNTVRDPGEDDPALFSYQWHQGTDTSTPIASATNADIAGIQGGTGRNYTLEVKHLNSGCTQTFTTLLGDASELPVVTLTPVSNAGCEAGKYTGSVTANITYKGVPVVGAALADYSFAWAGPGADANPATPEVLDDIINGAYSLTVTNTLLGCTSLLANTTVTAQPAVITIASTNTPSTNCAPAGTPDGAIVSDIWVDINNNTVRDPGEDDPALFSYQWHQGTDTSTPIASATNADIAGIQGGTGRNYTLEVKHLNSGCTQTFTTLLGDASELPVVTLTPVSNAGCEAGKYTGSVTANITYKGVPVVGAALADYSFAWAGPGADANPATPEVLDDIINGAYSLTVTNTLLGCTSLLANTTVTAQPAVITIASTNTPSTNCAPAGTPDGAIVSDIWVDINNNTVRDPGEDDPALFSYQWHQGTDTSTPIASATNADIASIQGGTGRNYTLEVKHLNSGCTQTFTTLLGDASELPVVTLTPTDNKGCTIGNYNGAVTATVVHKGVDVTLSGDYSFTWSSSDGAFVPVNAATITGLKGSETYTLSALNTVLGCIAADVTITVNDNPDPITVFFTNTLNSSCSPTGNGAILAGIDLNASGSLDPGEDNLGNLGDYNFTWHDGNTTTGVTPGNALAANNIDELDGNQFITLEVEQISTGCITTYTEWVQKVVTIPDITVTATDYPNNTCVANVNVDVVINNLAAFAPLNDPIADFTYTWYRGVNSTTGTLIPGAVIALNGSANGVILDEISAGIELYADDYTVVVQHNNSACISPEESDRLDEPPVLFDITPFIDNPTSDCNQNDGIAYVLITSNGSGYTPSGSYNYIWHRGSPNNTPPVKYFAYDKAISGFILTQNVTTASYYTDPQVDFEPVVNDGPGGGAIVGSGAPDASATLANVIEGLYTVEVEDITTGCKEYITFQMPLDLGQQTDLIVVSPDTDCILDNGTIDVEVVPDGAAPVDRNQAEEYDIYLFAGANPDLSTNPPAGYLSVQSGVTGGNIFPNVLLDPTVTSLAPGAYTITSVAKLAPFCFSVPTTITIGDWAHDPIVSLNGSVTPNTSCNTPTTPDGQATITINHNPDELWAGTLADPEPTYTIDVDAADNTLGNDFNFGAGLGTGDHIITGLGPTDYTITVTSSRGCFSTYIFNVPNQPEIIELVNIVPIDADLCTPSGSITVLDANLTIIGDPGATPSVTDYDFTWYEGTDFASAQGAGAIFGPLPGGANPLIDGNYLNSDTYATMGPGTYWVVAAKNNGIGLDCDAAPLRAIVKDISVDPTFTSVTTANSACANTDDTSVDGTISITASDNGAPVAGNWSLVWNTHPWLPGVPPAGRLDDQINQPGPTFNYTDLRPGDYEFTLTNFAAGCFINGAVNVPDNPIPPDVLNGDYTILAQDICNPGGSVTINQISITNDLGNPGSGAVADFDFQWYFGPDYGTAVAVYGPQQGGAGFDGHILNSTTIAVGTMQSGTYWAVATKRNGTVGKGDGCDTPPIQFVVPNTAVDPTFTSVTTANSACANTDDTSVDGTISITASDNGAPVAGNWSLVWNTHPWLPGVPPAGRLDDQINQPGPTFNYTDLRPGDYEFTLTNFAAGCFINGAVNVPDNPIPPDVLNGDYTILAQDICNPGGSVTINQISITNDLGNPGSGAVADFDFQWYFGPDYGTAVAVYGPQQGGAGFDGHILNSTTIAVGTMQSGTYWAVATKRNGTVGKGDGCDTPPIQFVVPNTAVDPVLTAVSTPNSACSASDDPSVDGTITITANANGSPVVPTSWSLNWLNDPYTLAGDPKPAQLADQTNVAGGVNFSFPTITGLRPGDYEVEIFNDQTTCSTTGFVNVPDNPIPPDVLNGDYTILAQDVCNPGGSITINQISITNDLGTPGIGAVADYNFNWYAGPDFNTAFTAGVVWSAQGGAGNDGHILNSTSIAVGTMQSGIYWAVATKRNGTVGKGDGCDTPPIQFVVPNTAKNPTFTYVSTPNSACAATDDSSVDGTITVSVNDEGSPVSATTWTLNWLNDPWTLAGDPKPADLRLANQVNIVGGSTFSFPTFSGMRPGDYEVEIFNDQANCSVTGFINVPDNPIPPNVLNSDYTILAQDICNPGGSITINQISITNDTGNPATDIVDNYIFSWYSGPDFNTAFTAGIIFANQGGASSGHILNSTTYPPIGSGTYWLVATKSNGTVGKGDGCDTPPIQFVVPNTAVDPVLTAVSTPNSACSASDDPSVDGTITITANANGSPVVPTSWSLNWLNDPYTLAGDPKPAQLADQTNVAGGVNFSFPTITGLRPGDYEVEIFNDQTTCSTTGFVNVPDNPIPPDVLNGDYTILAQDVCNPGGSITINQISITNDLGTPGIGAVADYNFNWYAGPDFNTAFTAGVVWSAQGGAGNDGHILNSTTIAVGTMQAGTYWAVATKRNGTIGKGDGCDTPPIKFVVPNTAKDPTLTYIATANTSCGPAGADGSFTLTPNLNGSPVGLTTWTYTISGPSIIAPVTNALGSTQFTGLLPGQYDITLSHDNSGCSSNYSIDIPANSVVPKLLDPDIDIVNQLDCNVGGSITINNVNTVQSISLNTVPDPVLSNYEFIWYVGTDFNTAIQTYTDIGFSGSNGQTYELGDPGFIGAGTYWVEIRKIATSPNEGGLGCISTPYKIIIEDQSVDPVIMFSQTANNACDVTKVNGTITAIASTSGISVPLGSLFTWYKGSDTSAPLFTDGVDGTIDQSIEGQETLRDVAPGIYTVNIVDGSTNCPVAGSFEVQDLPSIPDLNLDNATVVDQAICFPSGSITITGPDILVGGVALNPGDEFDFIFTWYRNDPNSTPLDSANAGVSTGLPIQGAVINSTNYLNIGADTYYVTIESKDGVGAGCTGPPISKVINDISTVPQLAFNTTVNSSCDMATPNGSIGVTASESDGSTDSYTFVWTYTGAGTLPPQSDLGATSTFPNAPDGNYSVTVTNTVTGCSFTQGQTLILDRSISEPNIISVAKVDPSDCNPTGSLEVTSVRVGGMPALVSSFEFDWYLNDLSTPYADPNPLTPSILEDLLPGKYFVVARELNTKCESIAKEVNILNDNIIYPAIIIVQDSPQTSCDLANPVGQLSATVDGGKNEITDPLTYFFTWYSGPVVDPSKLINNGNSSTLTSVASGEYTVEVLNLITGCTSTEDYFVEDASEMQRLQVSVSSISVTSCLAVNGSLEARVINHPDLGNFVFTWTGPNGYTNTGAVISNLEPGTYSVIATDITAQLCPSTPVQGIVIDDRMLPTVNVVEDNPVTNCDLTKLNGQLSASVNGKVGGYDFAWYAGTSATGPVIGISNRITRLDVGTYTVEVTDQITNCKATAMGVITDGTVTPPSPTALVLSNVNDCINPDGAVTANVNNSLLGYLFNWYDGNSTGSSPAVSTPNYSNLDIGDYAVTATDLRTGCISDPVVVNIADNRIYPEFDYNIVPANCESFNGSIELVTTGEASIRESIWYESSTGNIVGNGNLYNAAAGDYDVTVTTFYGCEADGQASIPTEITNYNGISANGDGINDDFQIDCITLFPNNNVKIFNRSGIKVYEADQYDNRTIVFRGIGENGLYLIGEDLPDGTYFYIIDKGDGSRPSTGYLELMR